MLSFLILRCLNFILFVVSKYQGVLSLICFCHFCYKFRSNYLFLLLFVSLCTSSFEDLFYSTHIFVILFHQLRLCDLFLADAIHLLWDSSVASSLANILSFCLCNVMLCYIKLWNLLSFPSYFRYCFASENCVSVYVHLRILTLSSKGSCLCKCFSVIIFY